VGAKKWIRLFSKEAAEAQLRVLTASFCFFCGIERRGVDID